MPVPLYLQRPEEESPYGKYANTDIKYNILGTDITDVSLGLGKSIRDKINKEESFGDYFNANMQRIKNIPPKQKVASWESIIDYSKGYDSKVEDRFRAEHRYLDLADYLSNFRMDTPTEQASYEKEIAQLRRYGRQYNAMHQNADNKQSDALNFSSAFDSGDIDGLDNNNQYKKDYSSALSILGRNEATNTPIIPSSIMRAPDTTEYSDTEASTISVTFNNKHVSYGLWGHGWDWLSKDTDENQFQKFARDNGFEIGDLKEMLGSDKVITKDGKVIINIDKSNTTAVNLLTKIRSWAQESGRNTDDVSYASYDTDNNLINNNSIVIGNQIQRVSNLLSSAAQDKQDIMTNIGAGETIASSVALPYMNEYQMNIMNAVNRGIISADEYKKRLSADNEIYENLLLGADFSKYEVYSDVDEPDTDNRFLEPMQNIDRSALKHRIRNAIKDKRLSFRAGIVNGKYGTFITIADEDEKGDLVYDKENVHSGGTFFIPELFTKSIQKAFDSSTQGKTVAEINSMQQYGYEYTLADGNVISNVGNETATLYDKEKGGYRTISRAEAQDRLHESIIIEDGVQNIANRMFTSKGERRPGYNYEADVKALALAATNEIYGGPNIDGSDVWYENEAQRKVKLAEGNVYKERKSERALDIYQNMMNRIYKLIKLEK